jgi:ribosome-associated protein
MTARNRESPFRLRVNFPAMVQINDSLSIPDDELRFSASRSGGPGGQNVNKVNSKALIEFDVRASSSLSDEQKDRILVRLANRITNDGILQVTSQQYRTQSANREAAIAKFATLIADALRQQKKRRRTKPSAAAREKRLDLKKAISAKKKERTSFDY